MPKFIEKGNLLNNLKVREKKGKSTNSKSKQGLKAAIEKHKQTNSSKLLHKMRSKRKANREPESKRKTLLNRH